MKIKAHELRRDGGRKLILQSVILVAVTVGLPVIVANLASYTQSSDRGALFCYPDGSIHFEENSSAPRKQAWVPSLFLSVTLGFGNFSFPEAKGIDVAWDLVVGRGGQLLLAMLTYPVVRKVFLYTMETEPTTFREFSSIAFDSSMSATSLYPAFWRHKFSFWSTYGRTHTWLRFAVSVLGAYLLTFPTIVSTMTGYQSAQEPYTKDRKNAGNLIDSRDLALPRYPSVIIVDGQRIGLTDYAIVKPGDEPYMYNPMVAYGRVMQWVQEAELSNTRFDNLTAALSGRGLWEVIDGYLNISTTDPGSHYFDIQLPVNFTSRDQVSSRFYFDGGPTLRLSPPPLTVTPNNDQWTTSADVVRYWLIGDVTMNSTWIRTETVCQPAGSYQWGFSFGMLLLFGISTAIYSCLLSFLQWHVYACSQAERYRYVPSVYRDVLDLAGELPARKDRTGGPGPDRRAIGD